MERIRHQNGGQKQQIQPPQHNHHQHQQQPQQQQQQQQPQLPHQRQTLGSCSSNCSSVGPPKSPLISSLPAFQYFKDKDQPSRGDQPLQVDLGAKRIDGRRVEEIESSSVSTTERLVATMPKKKSHADTNNQTTKPGNKIHIITSSNSAPRCSSNSNDHNNNTSSSNNNGNNSSSEPVGEPEGKSKYSVSRLIRHHHDEMQQTSSQFKRFSGNERCKWFFRSLRGERAPKSSDEASGSESGSAVRECSRCRLASLTATQLEENIDKLQSSLAEKSSSLERLSQELMDRDAKLQQLEAKVNRLSAENGELKASINRFVSEQHFGRRVLMTFDQVEPKSSPSAGAQNHQFSIAGARAKSACLSQPSLTSSTDLCSCSQNQKDQRENERETRNGISMSVRNINGVVKSGQSGIRQVVHDDNDDDYDDEEAAVFSAVERSRRHYPVIKPKPLVSVNDMTPMNRRIRELSLTDREWHSSEGFSSRVAAVATTRTPASGATDDYVTERRRSAKSSLELDDSLCVEYPNRTFRQQMECLKAVAKSVESLKSDPAGRRFKPRRRRGTVAGPGEELDEPAPDRHRPDIYNVPLSSTRKLSNYSVQQEPQSHHRHHQQQQQQIQRNYNSRIDDSQSEMSPSHRRILNPLTRAISTDYLDHSTAFQLLGRQLPERQRRPEFDPSHYYLRGQPNNNNNINSNSSSNSSSNNNNNSKDQEAIVQLKKTMERMEKERTKEQRLWLDEKMRVIEYQKKLQDAYLGLTTHCRKLEVELRQLRGAV